MWTSYSKKVNKFTFEQTHALLVEHGQTMLFYYGNNTGNKNLVHIWNSTAR